MTRSRMAAACWVVMLPAGLLALAGVASQAQAVPWETRFGNSSPRSTADIVVPPDWQGVWNVTRHEVDCQTHEILSTLPTYADTLCAGQAYDLPPDMPCTGTITGDAISITCSWTEQIIEGCTVTLTTTITGTRNGDSYSGSQETVWDYSDGCPLQDTCQSWTWEGTKTGADPGCRAAPADGMSWGALKGQYR